MRISRDRAVYVISVAAELAGVHPQTLRIYERKGLLDPARTGGGSRRYSEADIARLQRISNRPRCMVQLSGPRTLLRLDGPFGMLINPAPFYTNARFAIRVHNRLDTSLLKAFGKLCDKQFGPAIISGRNCNEGRGDQCNSQLETLSLCRELKNR